MIDDLNDLCYSCFSAHDSLDLLETILGCDGLDEDSSTIIDNLLSEYCRIRVGSQVHFYNATGAALGMDSVKFRSALVKRLEAAGGPLLVTLEVIM